MPARSLEASLRCPERHSTLRPIVLNQAAYQYSDCSGSAGSKSCKLPGCPWISRLPFHCAAIAIDAKQYSLDRTQHDKCKRRRIKAFIGSAHPSGMRVKQGTLLSPLGVTSQEDSGVGP